MSAARFEQAPGAPFARAVVEAPPVDLERLRSYRLGRLRALMAEADVALCVLVNPVSLRYALDLREYALFQSRIPTIYVFVPVTGPVVLHGAAGRSYDTVDEYRTPRRLSTFDGGLSLSDQARRFASALLEPTPDGYRVRVQGYDHSYMTGLAGIGQFFLRLAAPGEASLPLMVRKKESR